MTSTMKAVDIKNGSGPAENLYINAETPIPTPKQGEALVRVKAFGLNRMDLLQREGKYPIPPHYPKTLGVEFSGTIESLGGDGGSDNAAASSEFKQGDAVFGLAYGGAYAEYISVSTKMLLHKPEFLSWEEAAGIPETWITATQALFLVGEFTRGKTVLWHAGASGVSIAGIQLALDAGAGAVYATAGSDDKVEFIEKELGATKAFNYKSVDAQGKSDWDKKILEETGGKGVDVIIDFIGASYFAQNLNVAARDAHWVCLGLMGGNMLKDVNIGPLLFKRIRIEGTTLRSRDPEYQGKLRDKLAEYIPHFKKDGKLKVLVDSVFDWKDVIKAHQLMEENKSRGKIICTTS